MTLDSGSNFDVTINGTTAGTSYDQLAAGGAVNLAGATLNVSPVLFAPGARPAVHDPAQHQRLGDHRHVRRPGRGGRADGRRPDFAISYKGGTNGQDVVLTALAAPRTSGRGPMPRPPRPTITGPTPNNWVGGVAPVSRELPVLPDGPHGRGPDQQRRHLRRVLRLADDPDAGYTIASTQGYGVTLSGTIDASQASGSSTLSLPVDFGATAGTVTVDNTAAALAMGGVISGSAGLTKQGSGVLDLSGTNTYTGATTVAAGTLLVDGTVRRRRGQLGRDPGRRGDRRLDRHHGRHRQPGRLLDGHRHPDRHRHPDPGLQLELRRHHQRHHGRHELRPARRRRGDQPGRCDAQHLDRLVQPGRRASSSRSSTTPAARRSPAPSPAWPEGDDGHGRRPQLLDQLHGRDRRPGRGADGRQPPHGHLVGDGRHRHRRPTTTGPTPITGSGGTAPVAGDTLIFPSGPTGAALTSNNDIANTTFNSITIQASGYMITGDGIGLAGSIDSSQSSSGSTITLPITFNPGAGTVTVDNSAGDAAPDRRGRRDERG